MNITLYHIALVTHVIGITIMAGTTFIDFITFRMLCKNYPGDSLKVIMLEDYLYKLQRFMGIGMLLILASGVAMMIKFHEVWGEQLWFRIKMGILSLIILNGLALRRKAGTSLKNIIAKDVQFAETGLQWNAIKRKFLVIQVVQMLLFIIIYILSIFKFN